MSIVVPLKGFGGGGTALNFKIVGNPKPDTPRENTIWIDTDTPISGYTFSDDAPAEPVEGMVWIFTDGISTAPFAATKKNPIVVDPAAAYQYTGGAWVQKTAQTYKDDAWHEWKVYLFNDGQVNEAITGGINGTIQNGVISFSKTIAKGDNMTYTAVNKVDLTNATKLKCIFKSTNTVSGIYFRQVITNARKNGETVTADYLKAYNGVASPYNGRRIEMTLDVSEFTGTHFIGYQYGVDSDASSQRDVNGRIERWWLE